MKLTRRTRGIRDHSPIKDGAPVSGLYEKVELSSSSVGKHRTNHLASNPGMRLSRHSVEVFQRFSDDNVQPWSAPEEWKNLGADRLREYEDNISEKALTDNDRIAEGLHPGKSSSMDGKSWFFLQAQGPK